MADYPQHIVAVMGVVQDSEGRILLVQTPRRGWEPPGGQVECGEDLLSALQREIREESGIEIRPGRLVAVYSNLKTPTKVMLTFLASPIGGSLQTSGESLNVGWYGPQEALLLVTHPAQRLKLEDALSPAGTIYRCYRTDPFEVFMTAGV